MVGLDGELNVFAGIDGTGKIAVADERGVDGKVATDVALPLFLLD